jgi:hypothetical protein
VSEQNAQLHRRANLAIQALDADALVALCDPSIEVHSIFAAVGGAVYHGHEGVRSWLPDLDAAWSEFVIKPEAYSISVTTRWRASCCTDADGRAVRRS